MSYVSVWLLMLDIKNKKKCFLSWSTFTDLTFFSNTLFRFCKNASVRMYSTEEKVQSESRIRTESESPAGSVKCGKAGFAGGALSIPVALPVVLAAPRTGSRTNGHSHSATCLCIHIHKENVLSLWPNERNKEPSTLKR